MMTFKEYLKESNDNPNPDNVKAAIVAAKRKMMAAKSKNEREFYEKKVEALKGK